VTTARGRWFGGLPAVLVWAVVGLCCVLPVGWLVGQVVAHPGAWGELRGDAYRVGLLGRTLGYNLAAAVLAVVLGWPAARVIGRGRGWGPVVLGVLLPVSILLPSIAYAYAWGQVLRLLHMDPRPQGTGDVLRCVWTLATWLWGIPAAVMGLALRASDAQVQQQALLDGALGRVVWRQLRGAVLASVALVGLLAVQEFSVYERTGISVIATEVRMVFDTGVVGSLTVGGGRNPDSATGDQAARAAAAAVVSVPMVVCVGLLAALAWVALRGGASGGAGELGEAEWPSVLEPGWRTKAVAIGLVGVTLVVPLLALVLSMRRSLDLGRMWGAFAPEMTGTILMGLAAGCVGMAVAVAGTVRRMRGPVVWAGLAFLVGGQLLAIALIWIYNRAWLGWIYDAWPIVVMAYLGRFVWIALAAGRGTWSAGRWKSLREMAAVDGATGGQVTRWVVWPLAWPVVLAAGVLVMVLSMGEVPATVLLSPQRPPMIVPMMVTWVHLLRSDDMIEASILLMGIVMGLATVASVLVGVGVMRTKGLGRMTKTQWPTGE
jgi:ABC-type Fe3+ transport system permease subunit